MQSTYTKLAQWNKKRDAYAKLQSAYAVVAIALLLVAALISLLNADLGQAVLFYAAIAALTFVGNGVMWALVQTFVVPHIERHTPKPVSRKK